MADDKTKETPEAPKPKRAPRKTKAKSTETLPDETANVSLDEPDSTVVDAASEKKDFVELLYGVIAKPVATLHYIAENKPIAPAVILFVAVAWITAMASIPSQYYMFKLMPDGGPEAAAFARFSLIFPLVGVPFFALLGLLVMSAIYHGLAKLFKGDGGFGGLVSAYGFAGFPHILVTPFSLIVLIGGRTGSFPTFFLTVGLFALISQAFTIWTIFLNVIAIRENYELSTGKATLVYFIPVIAVLVLAAIAFFGFMLLAVIIGSSVGSN